MALATVSSIIKMASIIVWAAVVVKGFRMVEEGYGSKFTSIYPSILGSFTLFLVMEVFEFIHYNFFILGRGATSEMFVFGIKTVQLVAGILLADAVRKIYDINFATTGFMRE